MIDDCQNAVCSGKEKVTMREERWVRLRGHDKEFNFTSSFRVKIVLDVLITMPKCPCQVAQMFSRSWQSGSSRWSKKGKKGPDRN